MRQGKLIFMWCFVGFLIGRGQLVFLHGGLAAGLVFIGLEGKIARSRSQKIFTRPAQISLRKRNFRYKRICIQISYSQIITYIRDKKEIKR